MCEYMGYKSVRLARMHNVTDEELLKQYNQLLKEKTQETSNGRDAQENQKEESNDEDGMSRNNRKEEGLSSSAQKPTKGKGVKRRKSASDSQTTASTAESSVVNKSAKTASDMWRSRIIHPYSGGDIQRFIQLFRLFQVESTVDFTVDDKMILMIQLAEENLLGRGKDQDSWTYWIGMNGEEEIKRSVRGLMFCLMLLRTSSSPIPTDDPSQFKLGKHPIFRLAMFIYLTECRILSIAPTAVSETDAVVWFTLWRALMSSSVSQLKLEAQFLETLWKVPSEISSLTSTMMSAVRHYHSALILFTNEAFSKVLAPQRTLLDGLVETDSLSERYSLSKTPRQIKSRDIAQFWQSCWHHTLEGSPVSLREDTVSTISVIKEKHQELERQRSGEPAPIVTTTTTLASKSNGSHVPLPPLPAESEVDIDLYSDLFDSKTSKTVQYVDQISSQATEKAHEVVLKLIAVNEKTNERLHMNKMAEVVSPALRHMNDFLSNTKSHLQTFCNRMNHGGHGIRELKKHVTDFREILTTRGGMSSMNFNAASGEMLCKVRSNEVRSFVSYAFSPEQRATDEYAHLIHTVARQSELVTLTAVPPSVYKTFGEWVFAFTSRRQSYMSDLKLSSTCFDTSRFCSSDKFGAIYTIAKATCAKGSTEATSVKEKVDIEHLKSIMTKWNMFLVDFTIDIGTEIHRGNSNLKKNKFYFDVHDKMPHSTQQASIKNNNFQFYFFVRRFPRFQYSLGLHEGLVLSKFIETFGEMPTVLSHFGDRLIISVSSKLWSTLDTLISNDRSDLFFTHEFEKVFWRNLLSHSERRFRDDIVNFAWQCCPNPALRMKTPSLHDGTKDVVQDVFFIGSCEVDAFPGTSALNDSFLAKEKVNLFVTSLPDYLKSVKLFMEEEGEVIERDFDSRVTASQSENDKRFNDEFMLTQSCRLFSASLRQVKLHKRMTQYCKMTHLSPNELLCVKKVTSETWLSRKLPLDPTVCNQSGCDVAVACQYPWQFSFSSLFVQSPLTPSEKESDTSLTFPTSLHASDSKTCSRCRYFPRGCWLWKTRLHRNEAIQVQFSPEYEKPIEDATISEVLLMGMHEFDRDIAYKGLSPNSIPCVVFSRVLYQLAQVMKLSLTFSSFLILTYPAPMFRRIPLPTI